MKRLFYIFLLLIISQRMFSQCMVEIYITGLRNNKGNIMLQLFDADQKIIKEQISSITENRCEIIINDLKPGKYAIRYYHDENADGKLGTNFVGKPTEGYGFSNNVTAKFGPPPFQSWLFEVKGKDKMDLRAVY
jgi:uncharacterized protein (DUF2141 family)